MTHLPATPPPPPPASAESYHSAMLPAFGLAWFVTGLPFFFRNLRMEDHSAERVRRAAERGPVVYVLHTRSYVDWIALNFALVTQRLPLPTFTNGIDATPWMPFREMWRTLVRRLREPAPPDAVESGWLAAHVAGGSPTCIFLAPPRDKVLPRPEPDPVPALLTAQTMTDRPVQVVPVVVIWNRSPEPARTEVGRFLLGTQDNPGALGKLLELTTGQGDAVVQVGEPIALPDYLARYAGEPGPRQLKALRLALRRYLYREARVVRGPRSRPHEWVRAQVLHSREINDLVAREALATGRTVDEVRATFAKAFDKIAARFSFIAVRVAAALCRFIWNRIYSGIDVRPQDLDRIREALRAGTPVLVPCHRSHLDYLLISSLLFEHDIVIPHIVAGDNLSFWPLGPFLRRCGAFFIRRSFAGDRVFPAVFARYIRELVRMEVPVEFFIEGGRSRTGKLLPPKVGVLGMVLDAAADAREGREVTFLPVFVGYEQIAEERVYARELSGARKEKENVGQVVKATKVLRNRYGKVYLRVGEPMRAGDIVGPEWPTLTKARRAELLMATGERILHRINSEAVALPTALVALGVLAHGRRGLRHAELRARVERLRQFLAAAGVKEGGGLSHVDGILEEALGRFVRGKLIQQMEDEEQGRVYSIVAERRITLEFYKNTVMHAFAPAAFFATAVRALGQDQPDAESVARLFRLQQFLLRYEFVLDPDKDIQRLEDDAVLALTAYGALTTEGGVLRVADRARVGEIANLTANFLESYLLVLRAARKARGPVTPKDLATGALALGKTLLAVDEVSRPEALNTVNLDNAVRAFTEDGVLRALPDGRVEADDELCGPYVRDLCLLLGAEEPRAEGR